MVKQFPSRRKSYKTRVVFQFDFWVVAQFAVVPLRLKYFSNDGVTCSVAELQNNCIKLDIPQCGW